MNRLAHACLLGFTLLVGAPEVARAQSSVGGVGVRYAVPYDHFADTHDRGWGAVWNSIADTQSAWVSLSAGYTRFEALDSASASRINQLDLTIGVGIRSGQLRLGVRGGYFFLDENEWDVMPVAAMRVGPVLVTGEAKVLGDVRWYGGSITWISR
jgi:hypothetical protein